MGGVNVGSLVHEVTIQRPPGADEVDASGAPLETWVTLTTAFMARETERGVEQFQGNQESASVITRWTMKYRSDMDPDLVDVTKARRLLYGVRVYDIISAEPIDRQNGIVLRTLANMGASS